VLIIGIALTPFVISNINSNSFTVFLQDEYNSIRISEDTIALYDSEGKETDFHNIDSKAMDCAMGDIDGDDIKELIILTKRGINPYGSEIIVFKLDSHITEIYREDFSDLNPWKVAKGDVDGDGKDEISVGVYKKTPLHQIMAKRPFIYYYEDHRLLPKWRGSRLSKPFDDYDFFDIDGDEMDELISIEVLQNGEKVINTYKWRGFGFEGLLQSEGYDDIKDLRVENTSVFITVIEKEGSYQGIVKMEGDILKIERVVAREKLGQ